MRTDTQRRRRLLVVLAVLFVVLLAGCSTPFTSSDGTGDLTVEVVGKQTDEAVAGQDVTIKNADTGDVVFQGTTGPSGAVTTTLDEGKYVVVAGETKDTVEVDDDGADVELDVSVSPPKADEVR